LPTTSVIDEKSCTATIRSKVNEGNKLEVVLMIESNVRIGTPIRRVDDKIKDLPLADKRFYLPATISLFLVAVVYSKFIQPGFHLVDEGMPMAQKRKVCPL